MRIAVFGDLHLTPHPSQDKHWFGEARLKEFLASVAGAHDRLVIVGDLVQADYGRRLGPSEEVWRATCERYRVALDALSATDTTVIRGNHDRIDGPNEQLTLADGTVLVEHGDRLDDSVSGLVPFTTMWLMGRLRLLGLRRSSNFFEALLAVAHRIVLGRNFEAEAERLIEQGARVVAMGHSHVRRCIEIKTGVYVNAGACTERTPCFATIDTGLGLVALNKYRFTDGTIDQLSAIRLT